MTVNQINGKLRVQPALKDSTIIVHGRRLGQMLKEDGPLNVKIFIQVCDALSHAPSRGVLHRDIKPSNIMLPLSSAEGLAVLENIRSLLDSVA
ncbi:MAG TPA: hypothetical protein V6C97_12040 [Oculatellaceae cyanobacterium]